MLGHLCEFSAPEIEPRVLSSNTGKKRFQKRPMVGIYKSLQIHECRNWELGHAVSFLGI
jgi:hypothetical protein